MVSCPTIKKPGIRQFIILKALIELRSFLHISITSWRIPMTASRNLLKKLTGHFIRGLLAFLPLIVSLYVVTLFLKFFWSITGASVLLLPEGFRGSGFFIFLFRIMTAVAFVAVTILLGYWIRGVTGRLIMERVDAFISSIPAIRVMYGTIRQIIDLFSKKKDSSVMKPVLAQWPSDGRWTVGFLTGIAPVKENSEKLFTIFVPASPTPTSGFLLLLPEKQFQPLNISFEAAMKMVLTVGMVQ
jgi:uncharacterized membrane protein